LLLGWLALELASSLELTSSSSLSFAKSSDSLHLRALLVYSIWGCSTVTLGPKGLF